MKLISITDFVLEQQNPETNISDSFRKTLSRIYQYAEFLKQPLTLGMFVPCDEKGNVLIEPEIDFDGTNQMNQIKYERAKSKVLFKGFEINEDPYWTFRIKYKDFWTAFYALEGKSIEYLLSMFTDIELTETAIKQILGDA